MELGNYNKPVEYVEKVLTTGKIKYNPLTVNPDIKELKSLKDKGFNVYVPDVEPVYFGKAAIDSSKPEELTNYFDVTIYLRSVVHTDNIDRVTYRVWNTGRVSSTGKYEVINAYGSTTWLEKSDVEAGKTPENMSWYVTEGMKYIRRGEGELVKFIRSLRNLKNISKDSSDEDKKNSKSLFNTQDLNNLMKGDFKAIKSIILEVPDANVVFLTGVRINDGKYYQDFFRDEPMKSYMADSNRSDEWLLKTVTEAQANGRYANTDFALNSGLEGKEYIKPISTSYSSAPNSSNVDDLFEDNSTMNFTADDDLPF